MISQPDKKPAYIFVTDASAEETEISLKLQPVPTIVAQEQIEPTKIKNNGNEVLRLLLPALKALYSQDYALAIEMSKKAEKVSPDLAAPLVIRGQALVGLGKNQAAKLVLQRAKTIDPEDPLIIDTLRNLEAKN